MLIHFLAAEVSPFAKVGGLADVAGSLPKALARLGHRVGVVTPLHSPQPPPGAKELPRKLRLPTRQGEEEVAFWELSWEERLTAYFVDSRHFFRREKVYGYEDDLDRFALFSAAAVWLPALIGETPQLLHANDWHTAFALRFLKRTPAPIPGLFTIHNVQYQGHFSPQWFQSAVDPSFPELALFQELNINPNAVGLALLHAQRVNTVSRTYARELVTPEFAYGLAPLFHRCQNGVAGIVNGIDTDAFNPATDPLIALRYDADSLERRLVNKRALQERANLPQDERLPLFGMVSRLADQKGLDILLPALEEFLPAAPAQFTILGLGEDKYCRSLEALSGRYPKSLAFFATFDESLARLIYAGSDVFLMPSRFEPCGLGQLIAMRYGAVPLVRRTGGLADTVEDTNPTLSRGTGFVFEGYSATDLVGALRRAASAYAQREGWRGLQRRGMGQDFSWGASARQYLALYQQLQRGEGR